MKGKTAFTCIHKIGGMFFAISRLDVIFLLLFLFLFPSLCMCQEEPQYDEVTVYLNVQGIGGADAPALIKGTVAYLSVSDVFTLLKIKNIPSAHLDSLSGFFINPQDEYLIDRVKRQIVFQGKKIDLKPDDLILTETNLYMKTSLFGDVFGLQCAFSFRDLKMVLTTKLELPLVREMKMEQMRNNLKRLKGDVKTDTTIGRSYPMFKFGMADWSIATSQQQGRSSNTQLNLALGSVVAGGEMNVGLNYNPSSLFDSRQQTYLWRYANNDLNVLRQVLVGKMTPQTISTLNGSLVGIQLSNTPTVYRRSFGTYTLSNVTEPGWLVELYVNNVLVDYVKADASGFYKFEVPLVYGNSVLMVRMYGPWGELRTRTENANIPFNFLPSGELEYTINAGTVESMANTKFSRTDINYGLSRKMSIGGGYEYFSSPTATHSLPFIGSSVMLKNDLMIAGEYAFGVRLKGSLNYRLPSDIQLDVNYTGYEKGQQAILNAPLQERGISASVPIQSKHFSSYTRLSLSEMIYSDYKTTNAELLFSGNLNGVSSNVTTTAYFIDPRHINASSNFALSIRLPGQINLMPSAIYDYNKQRVVSMLCNLDKPLLGKGYLNISYERNFIGNMSSFNIGLRYDFSFMQTNLTSKLLKNMNTFTQSARGSLLFDRKNKYIGASNTTSVGRGGFVFSAFLDLNGNGKRDQNEPRVSGLKLRVNGGRIVRNDLDSTIRVIDLTPYTSYLVELDKNSFQSISWKIRKLTLSVYADPNQFKTIEVPVDVMSEASGTVSLQTKNTTRGLGRVYVDFYQNNQTYIGRTLTEEDGYFSFMGLKPGKYVARIDSSQLIKIKMSASPEIKWFTVKPTKEGDFVEGLDFTLRSIEKDSIEGELPKAEPKAIPSESRAEKIINYASAGGNQAPAVPGAVPLSDHPVQPFENKTPGVRNSRNQHAQVKVTGDQWYSIRVGEYLSEADALKAQRKIMTATRLPVILVFEDGAYGLWIEGLSNRKKAGQYLNLLAKTGFQGDAIADTVANSKNIPAQLVTKKGKVITYGPWKMQQLQPTRNDTVGDFFTYQSKGSRLTTGRLYNSKQFGISMMPTNTNVKSLQVAGKSNSSGILNLNKNVKNAAVIGPQYSIQVGEYIFEKSAQFARRKLMAAVDQPVVIVLKDGIYRLWIKGFQNKKEARMGVEQIDKIGFQGSIIKGNP